MRSCLEDLVAFSGGVWESKHTPWNIPRHLKKISIRKDFLHQFHQQVVIRFWGSKLPQVMREFQVWHEQGAEWMVRDAEKTPSLRVQTSPKLEDAGRFPWNKVDFTSSATFWGAQVGRFRYNLTMTWSPWVILIGSDSRIHLSCLTNKHPLEYTTLGIQSPIVRWLGSTITSKTQSI